MLGVTLATRSGIEPLKETTLVRMLNDDLAGLKKDFQRDFTVIMPLNMFGTKLLERRNNPRQKRGLISERNQKQRIRTLTGQGLGSRNGPGDTPASHA